MYCLNNLLNAFLTRVIILDVQMRLDVINWIGRMNWHIHLGHKPAMDTPTWTEGTSGQREVWMNFVLWIVQNSYTGNREGNRRRDLPTHFPPVVQTSDPLLILARPPLWIVSRQLCMVRILDMALFKSNLAHIRKPSLILPPCTVCRLNILTPCPYSCSIEGRTYSATCC